MSEMATLEDFNTLKNGKLDAKTSEWLRRSVYEELGIDPVAQKHIETDPFIQKSWEAYVDINRIFCHEEKEKEK